MDNTMINETINGLATMLNIEAETIGLPLNRLAGTDHRYLRDLKVNLGNALSYSNLSKKESYLLALSAAVNEKSSLYADAFTRLAISEGATENEIADIYACVSLLNTNNVFYRFRHFTKKEYYNVTPAGIKMNIMMNPVLGKEFFELVSLAVSALNGCEMCVNSHEESLLRLGSSQQRIYDAVRLVAIVKGFIVIG